MTPNQTGRVNVSATASAAKEQHHEAGTYDPLAALARPAVTCPVVLMPGGDLCSAVAPLIAEAFCEHEHRRSGPICSAHAKGVKFLCRECYQGESAHRCLLRSWKISSRSAFA